MEALRSLASSIGIVVVAMAALAAVEVALPLRARRAANRAHLAPNAALTALTIAINALFGGALALALAALHARWSGFGAASLLPTAARGLIVVLALDFTFYVAHRAMHAWPSLWRYHRVHHSDPAVDVTTTIRQHPGETVIRYAFTSVAVLALGTLPEELLAYRSATALFGLLEHANVRAPAWLDATLSLVFSWPTLHKVHHSRDARLADTNFGNITSVWDRLFGTFTPAHVGRDIDYGVDGLDDAATQSTLGLLRLPFRAGPSRESCEGTLIAGAIRA